MIEFLLSRLKSIAPGIDGISNPCWKYSGEFGCRYILDLLDAFCERDLLPPDIKLSLMVFLDKGGDSEVVASAKNVIFRHPLDTRPLSLKQADNKLVASTINFCISPASNVGPLTLRLALLVTGSWLKMLWILTTERDATLMNSTAINLRWI